MTPAPATTAATSVECQELAEIGFTESEISALIELKRHLNPAREYLFESDDEYRRLSFLKWCYENGQVQHG